MIIAVIELIRIWRMGRSTTGRIHWLAIIVTVDFLRIAISFGSVNLAGLTMGSYTWSGLRHAQILFWWIATVVFGGNGRFWISCGWWMGCGIVIWKSNYVLNSKFYRFHEFLRTKSFTTHQVFRPKFSLSSPQPLRIRSLHRSCHCCLRNWGKIMLNTEHELIGSPFATSLLWISGV